MKEMKMVGFLVGGLVFLVDEFESGCFLVIFVCCCW